MVELRWVEVEALRTRCVTQCPCRHSFSSRTRDFLKFSEHDVVTSGRTVKVLTSGHLSVLE